MCSKVNLTFTTATCPKCKNNALLKEDEQSDKTLICLYCGFYQTGSVSFYMHLTDVNQLRKIHNMEPIAKLIDARTNKSKG
jgi:hypothetical protein